ncbi:AAA family ATPase [Bauldia sp.]|uniref:AAA family ATPase n=1 Tax=Bauldia sp. TaxID=2575872 RepID=UPI003BADA885
MKKDKFNQIQWDLHVNSKSNYNSPSNFTIRKIDFRTNNLPYYYFPVEENQDRKIRISHIERRVERIDLSSRNILELSDHFFPEMRAIKSDLFTGRSYNIHPRNVKDREDISVPVGVEFDGSGTAATLFALWKSKLRPHVVARPERLRSPLYLRRPATLSKRMYDEVLSMMEIVNESIIDMQVSVDKIENFIRIMFRIDSEDGEIEIPLQNMSDGTAKWLALVTSIMTNRAIFAIEEPENYLHPYMQKEVIEIMRESTNQNRTERFAIITTHSETLLNAARPEEVILVTMEKGVSVAVRIGEPERLAEHIKKSGFGLGHYYLMGALPYA